MPSLDRLTDGLAERWRRIAWGEPARGTSRVREGGRAMLRACGEAVRSYPSDQLEMRANALTYRTLLSLVPLLAVVFSLFTAFGGLKASEEALRRVLAANLAPGPAEAAMQHL